MCIKVHNIGGDRILGDCPVSSRPIVKGRDTNEEVCKGWSYLSDTLTVLASEEDGPRNAAGILALQEERF